MKLRCHLMIGVLLATPVVYAASPAGPSSDKIAVTAGPTARFTVSDETQIPGRTLAPGTYTIQIVDHLADRMILRVGQNGSSGTVFLGLPKSDLAKPASSGPITLKADGKTALRGFAFSDGTVAEFVYPKAEAVTLAKSNDTKIPAIDPASEGRVTTDTGLSKQDMQMVTLWMLSPTPVGPDDQGPGVKATRYQQVASVDAPKPPRPAMRALPHTAGLMPTFWLAAFLCLCGAGMLRLRRVIAAIR